MPPRKLPIPPAEQAARGFFPETVNPFLPAESDVLDLSVGQLRRVESPRRNCTENDERSLNVIENTGCGKGISGNVIDNTGG
jgi:hypothetical protein